MTSLMNASGGAVAALLVAVVLWRWLRTHAYRYRDERHLPLRAHHWVLAALPVGVLLVIAGLGRFWPLPVAFAYAAALIPLAALVAIDLDVHRLPDRITYPFIPLALMIAAISSAATGDWHALIRAVLAGLVLFAAYFALMFISPGASGLGFGDVKLAAGLGILLGWFSWGAVFGGTLAAFIVSGVCAAGLLLARRATRKSYLAFGPFMALGAVLALLVA